jgi:hypothetical protein
MEIPKPLSYVARLQKIQRLVRSAQFRSDQKLAIRELCEAVAELADGLLERELGPAPPPPADPQAATAQSDKQSPESGQAS